MFEWGCKKRKDARARTMFQYRKDRRYVSIFVMALICILLLSSLYITMDTQGEGPVINLNTAGMGDMTVGQGWQVLFACLPLAITGLSSGIAQGKVAGTACGLVAKRPDEMGKGMIFAIVVETYAVLGLLGTIMGLIQAFTAVANANPAEKADLLSASISVAMNTTAFGLMVAIPLLVIHAILTSKTGDIIDSLEMATVKSLNIFTRKARRAIEA